MDTPHLYNQVRRDAEAVADDIEYVTIDDEAIETYAADHSSAEFPLPDWLAPFHPGADAADEDVIDFFLVGNALNYCFHHADGASFIAEYAGQQWEGSAGMWACLKRTWEDDDQPDPLDPDVLANVDDEQVEEWFAPSNGVRMPFLTPDDAAHARKVRSRAEQLRSLGRSLPHRYNAFHEGVLEHDRLYKPLNEQGLVEWLVDTFPAYVDTQKLNNRLVQFDKRAQLAAAMIYDRFDAEAPADYPDADLLTVFADYGVPAVMRGLGMIEYAEPLARRVDAGRPVEAGSQMEVELRAATVLAGDRLIGALNRRRDTPVTAAEIDFHLWKQRREMDVETHYTATDAY